MSHPDATIGGMCRMCEGFSVEDVLALEAARIDEYGFIVMGVDGTQESPSAITWSYTVGLLDAAGHPELIVAGPSVDAGGDLLNRLGRRVLAGARFTVGDRVKVDRSRARIGAVHPIQYELDTFNVWHSLRAIGALDAPEVETLQVFAPRGWFCRCHQHAQPDLSDPLARLDPRAA